MQSPIMSAHNEMDSAEKDERPGLIEEHRLRITSVTEWIPVALPAQSDEEHAEEQEARCGKMKRKSLEPLTNQSRQHLLFVIVRLTNAYSSPRPLLCPDHRCPDDDHRTRSLCYW